MAILIGMLEVQSTRLSNGEYGYRDQTRKIWEKGSVVTQPTFRDRPHGFL